MTQPSSLFPTSMFGSVTEELTLESVAAKLLYFQEQIHLKHWQTSSFAEHKALGKLYEYIQDFRDEVVEKLMGYTGRKVKVFKMDPLSETMGHMEMVDNLITFARSLVTWAKLNNYPDVENMAQSLSGTAAQTKYLLTLS